MAVRRVSSAPPYDVDGDGDDYHDEDDGDDGDVSHAGWHRWRFPFLGHASRVVIFQAPMADQQMIQPAMTEIIAQVGMGGICSAPPPPGPIRVPPASAAGFSW